MKEKKNKVSFKEMPKDKKKKVVIYNTLIVFFAAAFLFCGIKIGSYYWQEFKNESSTDKIIEEVVSTPELPQVNSQESTSSSGGGYYFATVPKSVDFNKLLKKNSDAVGWIFSQNGVINYPVLKAVNNDYYLNHSVNKTKNVNGSIFMDCKNNGKFTDKHTFIYGHSMKNGTMFATLLRYRNQSYYDAYPSLYLFTPYGKYRLDIFSAYETKSDDMVYSVGYNLEDYSDFISYAFSKSLVKADVSVTNDDRIVTLSTCAYSSNEARFVVIAKLVPLEENIPKTPEKPEIFG